MKKRILLLSIAIISFTTFSFADAPRVISKSVMASFSKEFSNASDIKWENGANFIKAQFTVNDRVMFAYYNNDGNLIAVTRFISSDNLPLELLASLKKNFDNYWVSDLFEIQTDNGTAYYATLESADQVLILKSEGLSGWQTFQKVKKDHAE